jgi:membrane protein
LAPLSVVLVSVIGWVYGAEAARGGLQTQLHQFMGSEAADAVEHAVAAVSNPSSGIIATILGLLTLLFGASGVAMALQEALNVIWDVQPSGATPWWGQYVREKLIGIVTVVIAGFVLILLLAITAAIAAAEKFFEGWLPVSGVVLQSINSLMSFALSTFLFALLFRTFPDRSFSWRPVWVGAAVTASLFTIGKYLIGVYLGGAGVGSAYGAAGSLVVVLVWVYYSAQVFFFGAEFTRVYAENQIAQAWESRHNPAANPLSHVDRPRSARL